MQIQSKGIFKSFLIYHWPINCFSKKNVLVFASQDHKIGSAGAKLWFPAIVFKPAKTSTPKTFLFMLAKNSYIHKSQ